MSEFDRDAFISTIVHDMRAPLNACLMSLSLIELKVSSPGEVLKSVEVIRRNLDRQAGLIKDLADALQLLSDGSLSLDVETITLDDLVDSAAQDADLPEGVGLAPVQGAAGQMRVKADPERLGRALGALLENVAATAAAGDQIIVEIGQQGGKPVIAVRLARHASSSGGARRKAQAMRLAVAHEIVAKHGGKLTVGDESGAIEL